MQFNNHNLSLYHNLSYGSNYEAEVQAVKKIIDRGVQAIDENTTVALRVFCRSQLTASLVMRNSTAPRKAHRNETNVVYEFVCPDEACRPRNINYIGLTRKTLEARMKGHAYRGAINDHFTSIHDRRPKVDELVNNTTIIHREPERKRLTMAEAVSIVLRKPKLNVQQDFDYVLPSCRPRPEPRPVAAPTQDEEIVVVAEYSTQQGRRPSRDVDTSTGSARRSLRPLSHRII